MIIVIIVLECAKKSKNVELASHCIRMFRWSDTINSTALYILNGKSIVICALIEFKNVKLNEKGARHGRHSPR